MQTPAGDVDDVGGGHAVADVGVALAVGVRRGPLLARVGAELRRHRQPQRDQIVGVVQVVELGRVDDLRFAVERTILSKLQVSEVAELVERDDVGDFGGFFGECREPGSVPQGPSVRR